MDANIVRNNERAEQTLNGQSPRKIVWPDGKAFAFTVFDDPDGQSLAGSELVYGLLADLGFRTTKAVWPVGPVRERNSGGDTCASVPFRRHAVALKARGFEIAYHLAAPHSSAREETIDALDRFRDYFGTPPVSMANHYNREAIYWGASRLSGAARCLYHTVTLGRSAGRYRGHVQGSPYFWGDVCQAQIRYCRNFVFRDINTLRACPQMPYHNPMHPWMNFQFASTEGDQCAAFLAAINEAAQDRLESEGGACIMYTHFGLGFEDRGRAVPRFRDLMQRMSRKNGWFVPASTLLDYLLSTKRESERILTPQDRRELEWRWLRQKLVHGTS